MRHYIEDKTTSTTTTIKDKQAAEETGLTDSQIARARKISKNGRVGVLTDSGQVMDAHPGREGMEVN